MTMRQELLNLTSTEETGFKQRKDNELAFVERVFPGCMALTFKSEEEWLEKRREFICASDTPCILGVGFRNNVSIWEDKCDPNAVKKRKPVPKIIEANMRKGKLSEINVRNQYGIDYECEMFDGTNILIVDMKHLDKNGCPFLAATLDGFFINENDEPEIIEIKRSQSLQTFGKNPPIGYRAQVLKQMLVTGAKKAVLTARVVAFLGGSERPNRLVKEIDYQFDIEDEQVAFDISCLLEAERAFWENNILSKKKPDLNIALPNNE